MGWALRLIFERTLMRRRCAVLTGAQYVRCGSAERLKMSISSPHSLREQPAPSRIATYAECQIPDSCTAAKRILFDHLVGAGQQRGRNFEAKRLSRLGINNQFEFGRLHDRKIGGLLAHEDSTGIYTRLAIVIRKIGAITN